MKLQRQHLAVALIFLVVLTLRLYFTLQTPEFSSDDSYFELNQIEHITETGLPEYFDEHTYGGRIYMFAPLYEYLLSFFYLISNNFFFLKLIQNIIASMIVIPVFLISNKLTGHVPSSLFATYVAAFIPVLFSNTINTLGNDSLFILFFLFLIYFFLKLDEERHTQDEIYFIVMLVLCTLTSFSIHAIVPIFIVYLIIKRLENAKITKGEYEVILFTLFFLLWISVLTLKRIVIGEGITEITSSTQIISGATGLRSIIDAVIQIGIIPVLLGFYVAYRAVFYYRKRSSTILISSLIVILVLLALKLWEYNLGLMIIALILSILFAYFYQMLFIWISKTRFAKFNSYFVVGFYIVFILTGVIPAFAFSLNEVSNAPDSATVKALQELKAYGGEHEVISVSPSEASLFKYYTGLCPVVDTKVLFVKEPINIINDIRAMYSTPFTTEALKIANDYNIELIAVTNSTAAFFAYNNSVIVSDKCFERIDLATMQVYRPICRVN